MQNFLDMNQQSGYNDMACINTSYFFVRKSYDLKQPTDNITGGEKNANI